MVSIAQIIVSIILIALIILQERSSGLSGVLGGSAGTPYQTRRGVEKMIYWGTIVFAAVFVLLALASLLL